MKQRYNSKKRGGKNKTSKSVVRIICLLLIPIIIAGSVLFCLADYMGIGNNGRHEVVIDKGMSTAQIASRLEEAGVIRFPLLYRVYSKIAGHDGAYNYGLYIFEDNKDYGSIAGALKKAGQQSDTVSVCIPEGYSVDQIAKLMEENGVCTANEFKDVAKYGEFDYAFLDSRARETVYYPLEGYLYPETYSFYASGGEDGARIAIMKMLDEFEKRVANKFNSQVEESGKSLNEILTMASIVELECSSASQTDKNNVAAVFYNRLEWDEPKFLGSDPTTHYGHGDKYNTYKTQGLPPGPLCSPSEGSISAALNPTEGFSACYFVTDSDYNFYYNDTLSGHNKTISSLKRQGKWIG